MLTIAILVAIIAILVAIVALEWIAFTHRVHRETEQRIQAALLSHYAPQTVEIEKRDDWFNGGDDFSYGGAVCFRIRLGNRGDGLSSTTFAFIESDNDGGKWAFVAEYPSMDVCRSKYRRG